MLRSRMLDVPGVRVVAHDAEQPARGAAHATAHSAEHGSHAWPPRRAAGCSTLAHSRSSARSEAEAMNEPGP